MPARLDQVLTRVLNVFISSKDKLDDERLTAAEAVRDLGMNPILSQSHYWVATSDEKEYIRQVQQAHIVILLLEANPEIAEAEDQQMYYRYVREEIDVALAKGRTVLMFIRQRKWEPYPEQLDDIIKRMESYVFPRTFHDCVELRTVITSALLSELFDTYVEEPEVIESAHNLYLSAADLIAKAKQRVFLSQATPSLLFGPRTGSRDERLFWEACSAWMKSAATSREKEFVLLFNVEDVRREALTGLRKYDLAIVQQNISDLRKCMGEAVRIVPLNQPVLRFAVFDHKVSLWLRIGQRVFGIAAEQHTTCDALVRMAHDTVQTQSLDATLFLDEIEKHVNNVWCITQQAESRLRENRKPFFDVPIDLLKQIIILRHLFVPALVRCAERSVTEQASFLREARRRLYFDCTGHQLNLPENYDRYFSLSDRATASFGLSLDRAHGEQHKLDVIYFGLKLMTVYWPEVRDELARLLLVVLNEHDEGRRVATDGTHEKKGAELVRTRMSDIGGFLLEDISHCADAVGNHAIISVRKTDRLRPSDQEAALLDDTLLVADCLSLLDPTRTIAHACKHRTTLKQYLDNWYECRDFMLRQIEKTMYADLAEPFRLAHQHTSEVISTFIGRMDMDELREASTEGQDVKAFCAFCGEEPYPALPIYSDRY